MASNFNSACETSSSWWFPPHLVCGTLPFVSGEELKMVWHAASSALDEERVRVAMSIYEGSIWYLAAPSQVFSSNEREGSACPFAACLPGAPGAPEPPGVYIHTEEDLARVMVVKPDHLGIYRGAPNQMRVIAAREADAMGQRPVDIGPLVTDIMLAGNSPPAWQSMSLNEAAVRHAAVKGLLAGAAIVGITSLLSIGATLFTRPFLVPDLSTARAETETKVRDLLDRASSLGANQLAAVISDMMRVENALDSVGGNIIRYAAEGGSVHWTAIVPPSVPSSTIAAIGGKAVRITPDGMEVERR